MALWEWIPTDSSSKPIETRHGYRGSSTYGAKSKFDQTAPVNQVTFSAEGMTWTEAMAIKAVHATASDGADGDDYTLVDYLGNTWVGPIPTYKSATIGGTALLAVEITMDDPAFTPVA